MKGSPEQAPDLGVLKVVGRLEPDVTIQAARAELDVIAARLARIRPKLNDGLGAAIEPLTDEVTAQRGLRFTCCSARSRCCCCSRVRTARSACADRV